MNPLMPIFQQIVVQELFERILFIWAIRHPASGYVQGINDLVTPFFVVFLSEFIDNGKENENDVEKTTKFFLSDVEIENFDIGSLPEVDRRIIEADSFWATSHLLEGIQDNYTFAQPGIQYKVRALEHLVKRVDGKKKKPKMKQIFVFISRSDPLYRHLREHHIEFLQFAFRWMNNLLMRELPIRCTIRLWDTYLVKKILDFHLTFFLLFLFLFRPNKTDFHNFICTFVSHFSNVFPKIFYVKKIFKYLNKICLVFSSVFKSNLFLGFTSSSPKSANSRVVE